MTYLVWGSTYLFSAFAISEINAFQVCSWRFLPASVLGFIIYLLTRKSKLWTWEKVRNAGIAGFIFLGLGTGGAIWSLNYLDSGFSALVIAAEPLIVVLLIWLWKGRPPAKQTIFGIALGISGILLLVSQNEIMVGWNQWIGVLTIFLSMLAWGTGSIFVSEASLPDNAFLNISIQLLVGGIICLIISSIIGEEIVVLSKLSYRAITSMLFLILFGSLAAFTAFNYLLKHVSTEKVVTNTYVNPLIAMLLGYLFNNEYISMQSILAAVVLLSGVFLINSRKV